MEIIIPVEFDDKIALQVSSERRLEITLVAPHKDITSWLNRKQLDNLIEELNKIKESVTNEG